MKPFPCLLSRVFLSIAVPSAILGLALTLGWTEAPRKSSDTEFIDHADLRGFGDISVKTRVFGEKPTLSSWTTFTAEDPHHAGVVGSKYVADLLGFGNIELVSANDKETVLAMRGGGAFWRVGVVGNDCHVLFARTKEALASLAKKANASEWAQVQQGVHPRWLDGFDNDGTAIWFGGGGASVDVAGDFAWIQERGLALCAKEASESRYIAPGVVDTSITDWFGAMCEKYDINYRTLLWPHRPRWLWNREPLPHVIPYEGYIPHPWMNYQSIANYSSYEPNAVSDRYVWDFRRRFAERLAKEPNFLGHHGMTEVPGAGILELAVVAGMPEIKGLWHAYLKTELGLDLPAVSELYTGSRTTYTSWDQVTVPIPQDFIGFGPNSLSLTGTWEGRTDQEKAGVEGKWFAVDAGNEGWTSIQYNDPIILAYASNKIGAKSSEDERAYWMRRSFDVTADQLPTLKYLHIARSDWHGNKTPQFDAYINGQPLKPITKDIRGDYGMCYEVGDTLKPGKNLIVLNTRGNPIPGYIFLGDTPLLPYPEMSPQKNRLWYDTINFSAWLRLRTAEQTLIAMRAVDKDRPLKMMAPWEMMDGMMDLCVRYGAYPHETGAGGGWYAPMGGSRYAKPRGIAGSSEQGGPPKDAADFQRNMTHYLMMGNDAVDLVFAVSHYRSKPDIAAWVDENREVLRAMGKMDLPTQPVGILRSTRVVRLGFSEPWQWDLARGGIQATGRTFNYAEIPDLRNGIVDQFKVLIDDGTVLMTPEDVDAIEEFVRKGGTFVALHNTGMHTPEQAYTWPISKLTGLEVTQSKGVSGNIRFGKDQTLWPTLKGQEIKGWGMILDYQDKDVTGESLALKDQKGDVEVIAEWVDRSPDKGNIAVARRKIGKGQVIVLGSTFWRDSKDAAGKFDSTAESTNVLDEMLKSLGVPREGWAQAGEFSRDIWVERWTSKNGVYDLYPIVRMSDKGGESISAKVQVRRDNRPSNVWEFSALGLPAREFTWKDDKLDLGEMTFTPKQFRLFAAPRQDLELSPFRWFEVQKRFWPVLPIIPQIQRPDVVETPSDIKPLIDGWRVTDAKLEGDAWVKPDFDAQSWKETRLGTFLKMGFPEDAIVKARTEVAIPEDWQGKPIELVFDAEYWFWGLLSSGRIWINGEPAELPQPIEPKPSSGFSLNVTKQAASGKLVIAVEIDSTPKDPSKPRARPAGVSGAFYLQALSTPVATEKLAGPWFSALDINALTPATVGQKTKFLYLQTEFSLPEKWPAKRVFLESPTHLGWVILNGQVVNTPGWMRKLDVSGLVKRDGPNVLRWAPNGAPLDIRRPAEMEIPELSLVWEN